MKKWNKKLAQVVLCLGVLSLAPNIANAAYDPCCDPCYDPCCDPCDFGPFTVGADFLWWKPCISDLDFAARKSYSEEHGIKVKYHDVCPEWEPGFRIRVGKPDLWCNLGISGSYTWLKTNDRTKVSKSKHHDNDGSDSVTGNGHEKIVATLLHPGLKVWCPPESEDVEGFNHGYTFSAACAKWDTLYQTWDVLLYYPCQCSCAASFIPFMGVEGLILNQELDVTYRKHEYITATVDFNSDYVGAGIKVGADYEYEVADCLKLFSRASGSLVVGENCTTNKQVLIKQVLSKDEGNEIGCKKAIKFCEDECCLIIPGYHVQLGAAYESCYCGMDFALRAGWEFVKWHNVPKARRFVGDNTYGEVAISTTGTNGTFAMHGLFAGVDFSF